MSNALIATFGGLCALVFWGLGDWLVARNSRKGGAIEVNTAFQIPGLLVFSIIYLVTHQHINSWHNIYVLGLASIIFSGGFVLFIKALATGSTGLVAPAACTYPLFAILLTAVFLSLNFTHLQVAAVVIIVAGVMMLAYEKRKRGISLQIQHEATILALLTALLWGVGNVVQNSVITKESWVIIIWAINVFMAATALLMLLFMAKGSLGKKVANVRASKTAMLGGTIYTLGSVGFYYSSVKVGSVLIPLVISSASPLVTSALGALYDQERLTLIRRAGAVIAVAGIVMLNV